jgi:diguanylate cyclase (GGDEF)-like protein/PAS domain S-box-containing protein
VVDGSSSALARRALFVTASLALVGSGLGVLGAVNGAVPAVELVPILACVVFGGGTLVTLLRFRRVALQSVATTSTVFFAVHLSTGSVIAAFGAGEHTDVFVYLLWFFPLLVYNKLVNSAAVGRLLGRSLLIAPLLLIACLAPRLLVIFRLPLLLLLAVYCLSYVCYGLTLGIVTRYREEYIVERERAESLRFESKVLESISDCFISLDSELRLVYLNDAACTEFAIERRAALDHPLVTAVPGFFSASTLEELLAAAGRSGASMFEAHNDEHDLWYEMRCFPGPDGMSIYFRNITQWMSTRNKLAQAHDRLSEQAELLDKAQDAIFVVDMDSRFIYWNKGAERLYGWSAQEVIGQLASDIVHDAAADANVSGAAILLHGEWDGELSQSRRDGSLLVVESRRTLVLAPDGQPRSILAINTDITTRKSAEAKAEHLAFYDVVTQLPNRLLLRERMDRALAAAARHATLGALLFIDLDDFKTLNDTLGHDVGDELLAQVATRLQSCVRVTDTVARFGGDEFVIMLDGLGTDGKTAAAQAKGIADKVLGAFVEPYRMKHHEYRGTASVGIALFPDRSDSVDDLLKRADLAMYRAKSQGRNAMCFFDPDMQTFVASRAALQSDLRQALRNREFELHYQPQVNSEGFVAGAEALMRWRHPRRGMVSPTEFIPLAEEAGLIIELGRWVLEMACSQLAQWALRPELESVRVAVNVSLRQLHDTGFVNLVLDVLRETGANPHRLKLEITESTMMEKVEETIAKMTALKGRGVGFSLDDFGTGYSSLSHLKRLPLDQLKIDRSFVTDVLTGDKDASIARTIIALGRNLHISVIAEGVETQGQKEFFDSEGCHLYQGFLFSAALTAADFESFARASWIEENSAQLSPT